MGHRWMILPTLCGLLLFSTLAQASTEDLGTIIERFVVHQFPNAAEHYWVIGEPQWDGDEMVVDLHTIVKERREVSPMLNHFLLLIVAGELKGVQIVPSDPGTDCQPEHET